MILQKMADAFRKQDWFTVMLEVAIVVVGMFIGLQVDDWNEGRKARIQEVVYLERIVGDLVISIGGTRDHIEFQKEAARTAVTVLGALTACEIKTEAQQDFANGLYHLGKISPAEFARGMVANRNYG